MKLLRPTHPGTSTNMARLRGRAPRGERLVGKVPHGHWKTTTFVAGCGRAHRRAMTIDGPMDGDAFLAYVEQILAPSFPGETSCWTMSALTRWRTCKEAIEAKGAKLALSSALFARLQSDREALLQDQVDPGAHRGAHGRGAGGGSRRGVAELHAARVHELFRLIRLRCSLIG